MEMSEEAYRAAYVQRRSNREEEQCGIAAGDFAQQAHTPAVVITNSVSTRILGANDDIEVTLDDGGEFNIAQCGESLVMDRDEAEALFMVLGNLLTL